MELYFLPGLPDEVFARLPVVVDIQWYSAPAWDTSPGNVGKDVGEQRPHRSSRRYSAQEPALWNKLVIPGQRNHAHVLHTIARHRSALLLIYLTTHRPTLSLP